MSGVFVIVDEQDPDVRYSSGWGPTTAGSFEYGGTMTAPGPQGATASYNFNGTSISVFGRIAPNTKNTTTTLSFAIDAKFSNSITIYADPFAHFHHKLFGSSTLDDGPHTLEITLTNVTSSDVFLDYLIYEASPNTSLNDGVRLLVLSTSPYLAYSQGWNPKISLKSGLTETAVSLNNSVEGAAELGATVALNFTGIGFEVRGLLVKPFPSPVASYSLDDGPWTDVQMPVNGTSYSNAVSNFEFVGQTFGEVGTHSLVITPRIPAAFFLDYIIVQSPTAAFPPKAAIAAPPSSSTAAGTPRPQASSTSRAGLHAGAVAGIVAGVSVCLALAALAWVLLRRRRTRRSGETSATLSSQEYSGISGSTTTRSGNSDVTPYTVVSAQPVSKEDRRYTVHRLNIGSTNVVGAQPAINVVEDDSRPHTIEPTLPPAYTDQVNRITTRSL
ncbi:hypothetical protein FB451DRAFT_1100158 [Mycena latifolia]|nr:hypothetical protein FB451DRAFT_1100158 [Mycena latifolia]